MFSLARRDRVAAGATRDMETRNASFDGLESEGRYRFIEDWNAPEYRIRRGETRTPSAEPAA